MSEETKPVDIGGPAFPLNWESKGEFWAMGLSARDYFAAKAMQGEMSAENWSGDVPGTAKLAYRMADAMLAERNK